MRGLPLSRTHFFPSFRSLSFLLPLFPSDSFLFPFPFTKMILLEPSLDSSLNGEASRYCSTDNRIFKEQVQRTLSGCRFDGTHSLPFHISLSLLVSCSPICTPTLAFQRLSDFLSL